MARQFQMQALSSTNGAIYTWLSSAPDWSGSGFPGPGIASDVTIATAGRVSAAAAISIACAISVPMTGDTLTVGVTYLITGTITRPGTVGSVQFGSRSLGAATVSGLTWSRLVTPIAGDVGTVSISATATDAVNGSTATAPSAVLTVAAAATFPATITSSDIVAWFNGDLAEYEDTSGTVAAYAPASLVRRVDEASPLTAQWQSSSDVQRPHRSYNGIRFDPYGAAPGTLVQRSATAAVTSINNATMIVSFMTRDGYGGPGMGLCASAGPNWGIFGGSSGAGAYVNGGNWQAFGVNTVARGVKTSIGVRWGSAQVRAQLFAAGVTQTATNTTTVTGGSPGGVLFVCPEFAGAQSQYGEISQIIVINRQITDAEMTAVLAWCDSKPMPAAFPVSQPLYGVVADSIGRAGVGTAIENSHAAKTLQYLRNGAAPGAEMCNVAIVGAGVGNNAYTDQLQAFKSASRAKQIALVALGTNNLANGQTAAATLTTLYALCDLMRSEGWKVVLQNVLPRQGLFNAPGDQTWFDAQLPIMNANLAANWASHADAFVDLASLTGLSNPANTTYYQSDKVHPTDTGHAAMYAAIAPVVASLL